MARSKVPETKSANLSVEQMIVAIPKLQRRITDLETFDLSTIRARFDPTVEAVARKIDGTLQEILGHDSIEYRQYSIRTLDTLPLIMGGGRNYSLNQIQHSYAEGIERAVLKLRTIKELFEERVADSPALMPQAIAVKEKAFTRRVFIVHGHDDGTKQALARHLSQLELEPVILHEQANQGKTIIEKFEAHSNVDFAVVLFTPDDIGYASGREQDAKPRARQNVVLELGFFMAALGRNRVCVLYTGGVEIPSDYDGVIYLPLDDAGAWRFLLAKEMRAAGIEIDLNRVT